MKRIYTTIRPAEADMVIMALREHEIEAHLEGDEGQWIAASGPASPCGVWVHEQDVERALPVIQEVVDALKRAAKGEPPAPPP